MKRWIKRIWTALLIGVCAAAACALLLGFLESFSLDVTDRSLAMGGLAALLTFARTVIVSTVRSLRYH